MDGVACAQGRRHHRHPPLPVAIEASTVPLHQSLTIGSHHHSRLLMPLVGDFVSNLPSQQQILLYSMVRLDFPDTF
uniref:Uncharacterized protein n=1 Tax=Cucumis melo TaxID=3656 RepID=A0A9I9CU07_CUCME